MHRPSKVTDLLQSGGFAGHYYLGRWLRVGFTAQCALVAIISAVVISAGSALDRTWFMAGQNVGLFQHPGIWAFFVLQIALPLAIRHSLKKAFENHAPASPTGQQWAVIAPVALAQLSDFVRLHGSMSKAIAAVCYTVGLAAFIWNTYQNQLPGVIVPFDFWDSSNHLLDYWITRVYKLYLFVWFLPYIALIHWGVLITTLRLLRDNRLKGELKLEPFHPDRTGGLGFVPGLVTTPIIVTLLIAALPLAAAFDVHRGFDVTPLMGMSIVFGGALIAYIVPIVFLRTDIVALKNQAVERLRHLQERYYSQVSDDGDLRPATLRGGSQALEYFDKVCIRIDSIPNYPHLARLLKFLGLAFTPSAVSFIFKLYETAAPLVIPLLKQQP